MVVGEMESWKNCESEIVDRADAKWLEKSDSAACLDMSMDSWRAFLAAEEEDVDVDVPLMFMFMLLPMLVFMLSIV